MADTLTLTKLHAFEARRLSVSSQTSTASEISLSNSSPATSISHSRQEETESEREPAPASNVKGSQRTHDISPPTYHIEDLAAFAKSLETAAKSLFPNRGQQRYRKVGVVLIRWEEDTTGVQWELDDLAKVFELDYGFETEKWLIPSADPLFSFMKKAMEIVENYGNSGNLLIVYYGGHGFVNIERQPIWACYNSNADVSVTVPWFAVQTIFQKASADVLFLLDCCAAASSTWAGDSSTTATTETIAACGFETTTPEPGPHSFTNALIEVLSDWKHKRPFSVSMLHCELLFQLKREQARKDKFGKKIEWRKTPIYIMSTSNSKARSIELCSRRNVNVKETVSGFNDSSDFSLIEPSSSNRIDSQDTFKYESTVPARLASSAPSLDQPTSIPYIIISISLEGEQPLDVESCTRWLQEIPVLAKWAKIEGVCDWWDTIKKPFQPKDDKVEARQDEKKGPHSQAEKDETRIAVSSGREFRLQQQALPVRHRGVGDTASMEKHFDISKSQNVRPSPAVPPFNGHRSEPILNSHVRISPPPSPSESSPECSDADDELDSDDSSSDGISTLYNISDNNNEAKQYESAKSILSPMKRAIVDRLMEDFWNVYECQWATGAENIRKCPEGYHTSSASGSGFGSVEHSMTKASTNSKDKKRSWGSADDEQNDGRDPKDPKRPRNVSGNPDDPDKDHNFACLFRKYDPRKYCIHSENPKWRHCALKSFKNVARVKEHLYKYHGIIQCPRCKIIFDSQEEADEHTRDPCLHNSSTEPLGITAVMEQRLRSRRKTSSSQTQEERWIEMYTIIFPGKVVPSAYFDKVVEEPMPTDAQTPDSRELALIEEFSRRELPKIVRRRLEERVEAELIEASIRNGMPEFIRDCQDEMFNTFRAVRNSPKASKSALPHQNLCPDPAAEAMAVSVLGGSLKIGTEDVPQDSQGQNLTPFYHPPPPQNYPHSGPDLIAVPRQARFDGSSNSSGSQEVTTSHLSASSETMATSITSVPHMQPLADQILPDTTLPSSCPVHETNWSQTFEQQGEANASPLSPPDYGSLTSEEIHTMLNDQDFLTSLNQQYDACPVPVNDYLPSNDYLPEMAFGIPGNAPKGYEGDHAPDLSSKSSHVKEG